MQPDIWEFPAKDVRDVDDGLGFGLVLGFCNVGLEPTDGFYMTFGSTIMNFTADAAGRDTYAYGHDGCGQ